MDKLIAYAAGEEISLWQALHPEDGMPPAPLKGAAWKKLSDFVGMVAAFSAEANQANAHAVGLAIAKRSGLVHALYSDKTPEGVARYENVQELLNALQGFVRIRSTRKPKACPTSSLTWPSSPTPTTKTTTTTSTS